MLHGSRNRAFWGSAIRYMFIETPIAFRREWRMVSVAHLVFYGPMLLTLIWVLMNPDAAHQFMDSATLSQMEEMYDPGAEMHHKQTEPPPLFTEATLVKKLEEEGIGRPSTYAEIISKVEARAYVEKDGTKLIPTKIATIPKAQATALAGIHQAA